MANSSPEQRKAVVRIHVASFPEEKETILAHTKEALSIAIVMKQWIATHDPSSLTLEVKDVAYPPPSIPADQKLNLELIAQVGKRIPLADLVAANVAVEAKHKVNQQNQPLRRRRSL